MSQDQSHKFGWQISSFIRHVRESGLRSTIHLTCKHLNLYPNIWRNFFRFRTFKILTACDIGTLLPKSTTLHHPTGIVIGRPTIGEEVDIYQNVTIAGNPEGVFPTIEDGVWIYSGAVIVGDVTIGENSIIGANSTVISDIPPNSVAVGSPAKVVETQTEGLSRR